jgi:formylglycine-generating enzyme required for sulfatase activity
MSKRKRKKVSQRLRWIPPGEFLMGSPEGEQGRYNDEGPQHLVTFSQGYWLADTACTQALWTAMMGNNPSQSNDAENPVGNVSWNDVQEFIARLNKAVPRLHARLPSESEWEYACRANTTTPFWFGDTVSPEQVNYDGCYPHRCEVKGEYGQTTVAVKSLPPNPWGLYEMHGNVWEWCLDTWHEDYRGAPVDGSAWGAYKDGLRVLRGGSWDSAVRRARSAYRRRDTPIDPEVDYGFRLARGQEPGWGWLVPSWASAKGRDEFGYWAEFSV